MTTDSTHEARIVPGEASAVEALRFYAAMWDSGEFAMIPRAELLADAGDKARAALAVTPFSPPADLEAESRELLAAEVASCGSDYDLAVAERIRDGSLSTIISPACALRAIQRALSARQIAQGVVDRRPDLVGDPVCKIESYNQMHEEALEMGYPSITEALEHLDELRSRPPSVEADAIVREMRAEGQMVGGTNSRAKIRQRITAWADRIIRLSGAEVELLREALKPFAKIKPSTLHPEDGSEAEEYIVTLKGDYGNPAEFTGADLARARTALQGESRDRA